ncbi:hypothetical protein PIB30_005430 [Stylosanthes scabra]|uniref:Uncharacterized protein n=1 Tax=Stylosanthes scabra TaxID=79078 RepID=A0ABU6X359_9FABA|nr:hypothetical protein [Stylosanthes scabra]
MAISLNILSLCSTSSLTSKPHHHIRTSSTSHLAPFTLNFKQQQQSSPQKLTLSVAESVSGATLAALISASLFFVDPALAFKGGGPYGQEVTRGQDLSGRDFSGKTLIKQDFKTANLSNANLEGALATGNTSFKGSNITGAELTQQLETLRAIHCCAISIPLLRRVKSIYLEPEERAA